VGRARREAVEGQRLIAGVVKVTPNYLLVEIIPGVLAMVPKGEFDPALQYSPGQEVEVTLLTINHATRRITGSIQHVADDPVIARWGPELLFYCREEGNCAEFPVRSL
jgi:ribosomal protein S1